MIPDQDLLTMYNQGLTYPEIADRAQTTAAFVQRRIRSLKAQPKRDDIYRTAEELRALREKIANLRSQGLTMKVIGRRVGIEEPQIYLHLRAIGLS